MEDKNYVKLAYIYQLLKNCKSHNKKINNNYFKAIIDSDFDTNYKLPSDCLLSHNKPQYFGNTVSHFTVEFYNKFNAICLDHLMQHNIDFTIKNDNGFTPLLLATLKRKCIDRILLYYYRNEVFTNFYCKNGLSIFHAACSTHHVDIIKCYLTTGVSVNDHVNNDSPIFAGYTPLHFAVHYGQLKTIKLLLDNGANLNIKDANRMTPLHLLIKRLMKKNILDNELKIFLQNAVKTNLLKLPDDIGLSSTHLSCILGDFKYQNQNINVDTPLNLDSPICPGYTPLHFAVFFNFDAVILLLEQGADLLIKDINGISPFDLCLFNIDDIIKILLKEKKHQLSKIKFTNGIDVLDVLQVMSKSDKFENYLQCKFKNINAYISFESPIWPGYRLLHLAVKLNSPTLKILAHRASFTMLDANGMSPLHIAFKMMDENAVQIISNYHACIFANSVDRDNLSHLHIACTIKNVEAIEHLLECGSNPNLPTLHEFQWCLSKKCNLVISKGSTPLHVAVLISNMVNCDLERNYDIVKILLFYGANPNIADANGLTPYHIALKYKCGFILKQMLKYDDLFDRNKEREKLMGLTKLHIACVVPELSMIIAAISSGVDINKCINFDSPIWPGDTALHILCRDPHKPKKKLIQLMLAFGADLNLQNASNLTPIHLKKNFLQMTNLLLFDNFFFKNPVNNDGLSHLHLCGRVNNLTLVENFLTSEVDVNIQVNFFADSDAGYTPLHYAVKNRSLKLIEMLLDYGADPNIKAANGLTPLFLAVSLKISNFDQVEALLRCPTVDVQATNIFGETALEKILQPYPVDEDMLSIFLNQGISVKYKKLIDETSDNRKLINRAIRKLPVHMFKQLMDNTEDLTIIDEKGQNVIHHICSADFFDNLNYKFFHAVKIFIDRGCELDRRNNIGKTPLHLAIFLARPEMAKVLIDLGADINVKDDDGYTPYAYIFRYMVDLKLVFVQHIHKLNTLGLYVDKSHKIEMYNKDLENLSTTLMTEKDNFNSELKKNNSTFSAEYFFSEKFIKNYRNMPTSQRQKINFLYTAYDLRLYFPNLYPVINLQINIARTKFERNRLLVFAAESFQIIAGLGIPEMCLEIVEYLNNDCLINLIKASNRKL